MGSAASGDAKAVLVSDWRPPETARVAAAARRFGFSGAVASLAAERHGVFRASGEHGRDAVIRFAPPEDRVSVAMQVAMLDHLLGSDPALPVPRVIRSRSGEAVLETDDGLAWATTYLPGTLLWRAPPGEASLRALGRVAARLDRACRGFDHPGLARPMPWDLRRLGEARPLTTFIEDQALRALAELALDGAADASFGCALDQAIHGDLNPHNVLVDGEAIGGVIDFGDAVRGPRLHDLAIAAAYHVIALPIPFAGAACVAAGYHAEDRLTAKELVALPRLVGGRLAMTAAITSWRAACLPAQRDYIQRNLPAARSGLAVLAELPADTLAATLRSALEESSR